MKSRTTEKLFRLQQRYSLVIKTQGYSNGFDGFGEAGMSVLYNNLNNKILVVFYVGSDKGIAKNRIN